MVTYIVIAVIVLIAAILIYKRKKGGGEVPASLQVNDSNGIVVLDTDTMPTRIVEDRQLKGNGSVTLANLGFAGGHIFFITITAALPRVGSTLTPTITITDSSLSWTNMPKGEYDASGQYDGTPARVLIGVY